MEAISHAPDYLEKMMSINQNDRSCRAGTEPKTSPEPNQTVLGGPSLAMAA
jgi:hypothetical protein